MIILMPSFKFEKNGIKKDKNIQKEKNYCEHDKIRGIVRYSQGYHTVMIELSTFKIVIFAIYKIQ